MGFHMQAIKVYLGESNIYTLHHLVRVSISYAQSQKGIIVLEHISQCPSGSKQMLYALHHLVRVSHAIWVQNLIIWKIEERYCVEAY